MTKIDRAKVLLGGASKFYFCHICRGAIENLMGVRVLSEFKIHGELHTVVYFYRAYFNKKALSIILYYYLSPTASNCLLRYTEKG